LTSWGICSWIGAARSCCFQVLTEREERSAIAIASNEPFSSWTKTFTDPRLCAAVVDRLTFAGQIIETGSASYRLAYARNARPASGRDGRLHRLTLTNLPDTNHGTNRNQIDGEPAAWECASTGPDNHGPTARSEFAPSLRGTSS
jgi:hypothetical protein